MGKMLRCQLVQVVTATKQFRFNLGHQQHQQQQQQQQQQHLGSKNEVFQLLENNKYNGNNQAGPVFMI